MDNNYNDILNINKSDIEEFKHKYANKYKKYSNELQSILMNINYENNQEAQIADAIINNHTFSTDKIYKLILDRLILIKRALESSAFKMENNCIGKYKFDKEITPGEYEILKNHLLEDNWLIQGHVEITSDKFNYNNLNQDEKDLINDKDEDTIREVVFNNNYEIKLSNIKIGGEQFRNGNINSFVLEANFQVYSSEIENLPILFDYDNLDNLDNARFLKY